MLYQTTHKNYKVVHFFFINSEERKRAGNA